MRVRQRVRQRGVELTLVILDHADWAELTALTSAVDFSALKAGTVRGLMADRVDPAL